MYGSTRDISKVALEFSVQDSIHDHILLEYTDNWSTEGLSVFDHIVFYRDIIVLMGAISGFGGIRIVLTDAIKSDVTKIFVEEISNLVFRWIKFPMYKMILLIVASFYCAFYLVKFLWRRLGPGHLFTICFLWHFQTALDESFTRFS